MCLSEAAGLYARAAVLSPADACTLRNWGRLLERSASDPLLLCGRAKMSFYALCLSIHFTEIRQLLKGCPTIIDVTRAPRRSASRTPALSATGAVCSNGPPRSPTYSGTMPRAYSRTMPRAYSRTMPTVGLRLGPCGGLGGGQFLMREVPLYRTPTLSATGAACSSGTREG